MFSGIVQASCPIKHIEREEDFLRYSVELPERLCKGVQVGASISVDGACQTVVDFRDSCVFFEAIKETLSCTNLSSLALEQLVNIERSICLGDEIGGHLLSGHVSCVGKVITKEERNNELSLQVSIPERFACYLFPKGFIGVQGASLTLGEVGKDFFWLHLIPETLKITNLAQAKEVNIEFDANTVMVVETVKRVLASKL